MQPRLTSRGTLINWLIQRYGFKSYLEVGVSNPARNFDCIECAKKQGVEPDSAHESRPNVARCASDEFFKQERKYDIIFVDGDHRCMQAVRDISNALCSTPDNGIVVVHDCNPWTEEIQHDDVMTGTWLGGVWRAWAMYRSWSCLDMCVVDFDMGCGVIHKGRQEPWPYMAHWDGPVCKMPYAVLEKHRKELLNLVTAEEFVEKYGC